MTPREGGALSRTGPIRSNFRSVDLEDLGQRLAVNVEIELAEVPEWREGHLVFRSDESISGRLEQCLSSLGIRALLAEVREEVQHHAPRVELAGYPLGILDELGLSEYAYQQ